MGPGLGGATRAYSHPSNTPYTGKGVFAPAVHVYIFCKGMGSVHCRVQCVWHMSCTSANVNALPALGSTAHRACTVGWLDAGTAVQGGDSLWPTSYCFFLRTCDSGASRLCCLLLHMCNSGIQTRGNFTPLKWGAVHPSLNVPPLEAGRGKERGYQPHRAVRELLLGLHKHSLPPWRVGQWLAAAKVNKAMGYIS